MSKPVTYYVQNNAIDALTARFGSCLQYLPRQHKEFMLKCIVHQLSDGTPMSDLIDSLDRYLSRCYFAVVEILYSRSKFGHDLR